MTLQDSAPEDPQDLSSSHPSASPRSKTTNPLRALVKALTPVTARDAVRAHLRDARRGLVRRLIWFASWLDLNIAQNSDIYSPLPVLADLKRNRARWMRPSALAGVEIDTRAIRDRFTRLHAKFATEFDALPSYDQIQAFGLGPGFTPIDGRTLYYMLRDVKPTRYLEIGSGMSTYYCSLAAERNKAEGSPLEIICVEPYPYAKLREIPGVSQIMACEVQDVDISVFEKLTENDFLFIDSSHVVRIDGDVPYMFLDVLPRLNAGVNVQIHDIPFPYNIPHPAQHWVFGTVWPRFWTEAMLTQAFLAFNRTYKVQLSLPYWRFQDEESLRRMLPEIPPVEEDNNPFSSLWLKKIS
jgi:hypothetical protein